MNRTRQLTQVFSAASTFVDGFTLPLGEGETSILDGVNDALADLSLTRIRTQEFSVASVVGQRYYTVEETILEIISCTYAGRELEITSLEGLREDEFESLLTTNGSPTRLFRLGSRYALWPAPSATTNHILTASTALPTLVNAADTLTHIPLPLQRKVPYVGALILAQSDAENPAHATRIGYLQSQAASLFFALWALNTKDFSNPANFDIAARLPAYLSNYANAYKPGGATGAEGAR